jgi:hypothetical protein
MLAKLKQTPPKVLLATAMLLVLVAVTIWLVPGAIIALTLVAATGWSVFTVLNYWIG